MQVFHCYWDTAFIYVFGQLFGGLIAAAMVLPLYGFGQFGSLFDTRMFKWLGVKTPHHFAGGERLATVDPGAAEFAPPVVSLA